MMADPIPLKRVPLPKHEDVPPEVRAAAQSLHALSGRISRVLTANAAMPDMKANAKAELITLARDALALHGAL